VAVAFVLVAVLVATAVVFAVLMAMVRQIQIVPMLYFQRIQMALALRTQILLAVAVLVAGNLQIPSIALEKDG
jgi:hypothetical protein